jgi:hypothetical protein
VPAAEACVPNSGQYRYVYGDERIFFVDPANRRVVQIGRDDEAFRYKPVVSFKARRVMPE